MLSEEVLARVHGIASRPELNGTCVKLGKRTHADMNNERWESRDEFTGAEAQYRPSNLSPLPPMQPLACNLYKILATPFLVSCGSSNDLIYHVLSHDHKIPLMHLSLLMDKSVARALPLVPHARLEAMRTAALELSAVHAGFSLSHTTSSIVRPPLPQSAREQVAQPTVDRDTELTALHIGAAADTLPSVITLPQRVDYLHALAEHLRAPSVAPFPLAKGKGAQRIEQPVLYVAVGSAEVQARPSNLIASALAGVEVRGDALLTSLEFRDSAGVEGLLSARVPCGLPVVIAQLLKRSGSVVEIVDSKLGRPLLGARTIPRVEAWPVGVEVSGQPCPSPKSLLLEYSQAWPQPETTLKTTAWPVGSDGVSPPDTGAPPRGFRAGFRLEWPAAAPLPEGAVRCDDGARISMQTAIYSRKSASKQDQVQSAEPQAAVMMLRALHRRNEHAVDAVAAATSTSMGPAFHSIKLLSATSDARTSDATSGDTQDAAAHVAGSRLCVSYTLKLLPAGSASLPEDVATEEGLLLLEARTEDRVLLGGGVLASAVEDVLAEMAVGSEQRLLMQATLLMQPVACVLWLRLHSSEPPGEEAPQQSHFNAFRPGGGVPHAQERAAFVADVVSSWAPSSLADVGCGDGKVLEHLIARQVPVPHMLGADVQESALRRAGRKLGAALALASAEPGDGGAPHIPPHVELFYAGLSELRLSCEAITLVEVIEHLDPWILERLGPELLGRCAPRWLLVTTPNKEYNLNFLQPPTEWQEGAMKVPDVGGYPLRNPDHRFEWTRDEFRAWAEGLAHDFGYTVSFHGIGGGPFDERVPYGVWRGPGPQTQAVVFERLSNSSTLPAPWWLEMPSTSSHAAPGADATATPLHGHESSLVWCSRSAG